MLEQTAPVTNEDNLHEVLMQLEAIIFASDAPVSLARLKDCLLYTSPSPRD